MFWFNDLSFQMLMIIFSTWHSKLLLLTTDGHVHLDALSIFVISGDQSSNSTLINTNEISIEEKACKKNENTFDTPECI